MAKLKREVTAKNALNKTMQAKLGAALQEVEATKEALATAEDERDMTSEKMESVMVELNATNEALIRVKATSATINTLQTNNRVFNVKTTGLPTYDGTRTLDAVTSFLSTLHRHFGPRALELGLIDECGIPLTNGWAAAALLQFRDKAAVWANHRFPAYASAGVTWEDFTTAVKEAFIPPDAVTRLKRDWESLRIKGGERVSAFNERFRVLRHQLEPHAPLSDERLRDSYQFKLETNPEASKALIEKLGNQPTASLNDVMDHVSRVDAMLNSKKQSISTTLKRMEGKQREDGGGSGGGGSNDRSCYACGEVGHPARTCPNKEKVLAAWREKKLANDKKGSGEKQKERADRRRGSRGGRKKGGNGGGGGGKQQSLRLTQQAPGEGNDAKEPRVQELSDDSDDDSDDSSSGNGNGSD
jgi:hypothetical protein